MSAITVFCNRDGLNPDRGLFSMVFSRLAHRGIDGNNVISKNWITIGHHHFWTTPEEVGEEQPIYSADKRLILALDGRIDNRQELFTLVGNSGGPRNISDAYLLLELFKMYGEKIVEKVIGPFLIVIYDETKKELILARDPVGDRTIYYYYDDKVFIASSEEQSLLGYPSVSTALNEKSVVKLLMLFSLPDYGETFFRDVKELPPAHKINITKKNISVSRYWTFKKNKHSNSSKNLEELSSEYLQLLEKSVESCMRSVYEPAVMMSGGIDSTTVSAIAAIIMERKGLKNRLTTISGVFNDLTNCNETRFIDDLADKHNTNTIKIPCDDAFPLSEKSAFYNNPNTPFEDPFAVMADRIYSVAFQNNNRVILSGHFADDLYYRGKYEYLLDLAKNMEFSELIINLLKIFKAKGFTGLFNDPAVRRFAGIYRLLFKRDKRKKYSSIFTDHALKLYDELNFSYPQYDNEYINLNSTKISTYGITNAELNKLDIRYPYRDRRVIEFINNIPNYYLYNRGVKKLIVRKALKGKLPKSIINRDDNISLQDLYNKGLPLMSDYLCNRAMNNSAIWKKYAKESAFRPDTLKIYKDVNSFNFLKWCCVSLDLWSHKYNYN